MMPRVHDLLLLRSPLLKSIPSEEPAWLATALQPNPWVVVRREASDNGAIPIGIRGADRSQRCAGFVDPGDVIQIKTPTQLRSHLLQQARRDLPASQALLFFERHFADIDLAWGPGGSLGFELASSKPVVTNQSDLDLVMYAPQRLSHANAFELWQRIVSSSYKVDALVETPHCGFSLQEFASRTSEKILLRTPHGRVLGQDPWAFPDNEAA